MTDGAQLQRNHTVRLEKWSAFKKFLLIGGALLAMADVYTDIALVLSLYPDKERRNYAYTAIAIISLRTCVEIAYSAISKSDNLTVGRFVLTVLQLNPIVTALEALRRQSIEERLDLAANRIIEVLFESFPQVLLQLHLALRNSENADDIDFADQPVMLWLSMAMTLLSITSGYHAAVHTIVGQKDNLLVKLTSTGMDSLFSFRSLLVYIVELAHVTLLALGLMMFTREYAAFVWAPIAVLLATSLVLTVVLWRLIFAGAFICMRSVVLVLWPASVLSPSCVLMGYETDFKRTVTATVWSLLHDAQLIAFFLFMWDDFGRNSSLDTLQWKMYETIVKNKDWDQLAGFGAFDWASVLMLLKWAVHLLLLLFSISCCRGGRTCLRSERCDCMDYNDVATVETYWRRKRQQEAEQANAWDARSPHDIEM